MKECWHASFNIVKRVNFYTAFLPELRPAEYSKAEFDGSGIESINVPGQKWTFLGFECDGKDIDVCKVSVQKLKAKMRRKARALRRWAEVNGKDGWMAARAFIKHFNKKLYTSDDRSEINRPCGISH